MPKMNNVSSQIQELLAGIDINKLPGFFLEKTPTKGLFYQSEDGNWFINYTLATMKYTALTSTY